ncbi:MAG: uroporphyrinogen decarboxylase family protein [Kiritimatiellae bacterium]|nr:uroporphyrinogen decarboxylase family protein [Kiritimatiellia bacterium]
MTSKERVLKAVNSEEADRVPLDYFAMPEIDERLKLHLGVKTREELLQKLGIDFRIVAGKYKGAIPQPPAEGIIMDEWGVGRKAVSHGTGVYNQECCRPLENARTVDEVENHRWPSAEDYDFSGIREECKMKKEYAICGSGPTADWINRASYLRGFDNFLVDLAEENPVSLRILDKMTDFYCQYDKRLLEEAGGGIDILWIGDDYGTQKGLLLSREMWRKVIRPHVARIIILAHDHGAKIMFHSCGSIRELMPDLIETGVDIIDTLQPEAKGMAPSELKGEFYGKVAFHGMISTAGTLACGKPENVRREVMERLRVMKPGGGYMLAPTHFIQSNTPEENIVEMYKTAREYGCY